MIGTYSWWQWLLFFYIYCFAGWIWECVYVAARTRRWVNRGFLHLPLLPLYGSGAVVILFFSLPFSENLPILYLAGMGAATMLELVTGLTMEAVYKVKYWDYTGCLLNYRGVICLKASLCWGVFSVLMVRFVHVRVENLLKPIPLPVILIAEAVISVLFVYDLYICNRDALRLARILSAMEKAKEQLQEDLRRMEEELETQRRHLEEELEEHRQMLEREMHKVGDRAEEKLEEAILTAIIHTENARVRALESRRRLEESVEMQIAERRQRIEEMRHMTEHAVEEARLNAMFRREDIFERLQDMREKYLEEQEANLKKAERISRSMLLRNPSAHVIHHIEMSALLRRKAENWMEEKARDVQDQSSSIV